MTEENTTVETEEEVETTEQTNDEGQENTTFTQSEVDSRISKAVESALTKNNAKQEKLVAERIEKERQDAMAYAKLTEKEKSETDYNKRLEELDKREQEINNRQLLSQVESDLQKNDLPAHWAETLVLHKDNEVIKTKISEFNEDVERVVGERVKSALRQDTPKIGTTSTGTPAPSISDIAQDNRIIK